MLLFGVPLAAAEEPAQQPEVSYVITTKQPFLNDPGGSVRGYLSLNTPVAVQEKRGEWARVTAEGWVNIKALSGVEIEPEEAVSSDEQPLTLIEFKSEEKRQGRRPPRVFLHLTVMNNSDKPILRWRGVLLVRNLEGKILFRENIISDKVAIPPKENRQISFAWSPHDSVYDTIRNATPETVRLSIIKLKMD